MKELLLVLTGGVIGFLSALGMKIIMDHMESR